MGAVRLAWKLQGWELAKAIGFVVVLVISAGRAWLANGADPGRSARVLVLRPTPRLMPRVPPFSVVSQFEVSQTGMNRPRNGGPSATTRHAWLDPCARIHRSAKEAELYRWATGSSTIVPSAMP